MPVDLEINDVQYTNFTSAGVTLALDTLANDFAFEAVLPAGKTLPVKVGDRCRVIVEGTPVLTGFVENITGNYSADNHNIAVTGRDKTMDLIDSTIDVINDIRAPITLKEVIEKVIAHIGADLEVIDNATPESFNKAEDIIAPQPGSNAFALVEEYAQKRQVLLTSNADGNIVITQSQPIVGGGLLQNAINSDSNNIISASWSSLTSDLFNKYIQKGQQDPVALNHGNTSSDEGIIAQRGEDVDKSIRPGRQLVVMADKGFSQEQLQNRAEWSKKIRQTRSVAYSANVQGFKNQNGELWAINTTASVIDEFANINHELLINAIQFTSGSNGSITRLDLVETDAYELIAVEPQPVGANQDSFKLDLSL